jgi:hypothetical protein
VFWTQARREARRRQVLDELMELDPSNRRERLGVAVAAHDLRLDEVEPALHLVERLDRLRRMTVPLGGRLPDADLTRTDERTAIPVVADADPNPVATWLGAVDLPLDAIEAVSRSKAGRRVRHDRPDARVAGTSRRKPLEILAPTSDASSAVADVVAAEALADENWPSIAWLRP